MFYEQEFKNHIIGNDMSEKSVISYMHSVDYFVKSISVDSVLKIQIQQLDEFKNKMYNDGLKKSTKSKMISHIRVYLNFLYDYGYAKVDLHDKIKPPKLDKGKIPVFLTQEEFSKKFNAIFGRNQIRDKAIIAMFISTGMRESELYALNKSDIVGNTITIYGGKGDKTRTVYLNQEALEFLNQYYEMRKDEDEAVFLSELGNRISIQTIIQLVKHHMGVSPHKLRHSAASIMIANNVDLATVRQLLGHASLQTTSIYAHSIKNNLKNASSTITFHT